MNRRFATPAAACSLTVGLILLCLTWVCLLATSLANAFNDVIALTGLLYAAFYILTALAAITYYRRRIFSNVMDAVVLGILPLAAAAFLGWILVKSLVGAPNAADLVDGRRRWCRGSPHARRALRASIAVLQRPARERRPDALARDRSGGSSRTAARLAVTRVMNQGSN